MARLLENLGRHIARRATGCGQNMKLLFVHNSRQAKICDQQVRIVLGRSEQQILGLEVSVHDTMVMQIRNR